MSRIYKLKNIIIGDTISYKDEESDEYINAKVIHDSYISNNAIHIISLHILWTDKQGDIAKTNVTCQKRASWLYENASTIEKSIKGRKRRKQTKKKKNIKRKTYGYKF